MLNRSYSLFILASSVLYYTVVYTLHDMLYCIVLYCTVLLYSPIRYYYDMLYCTTLKGNEVLVNALPDGTLPKGLLVGTGESDADVASQAQHPQSCYTII